MDRVFSVGDISDQFWSPPPPPPPPPPPSTGDRKMNKSCSEWDLERFLQATSTISDTSSSKSIAENDVVEITDPHQSTAINNSNDITSNFNDKNNKNSCTSQSPASKNNVQSLRNTSSSFNASGSRLSVDSDEYQALLKSKLNLACAAVALTRQKVQPRLQLIHNQLPFHPCKGSQDKDAKPIGIPSLPTMPKKPVTQAKQATSYSSDQSDDDDLEGENDTDNIDPADVKRVRRVTGMNPLLQAMSEISAMGMGHFGGSPCPSDSADAAVPVQDEPKQSHYYHQPVDNPLPGPNPRADNNNNNVTDISSIDNVMPNAATQILGGSKIGRTASMQRVASLEHLQKRIRGEWIKVALMVVLNNK
ncbi:Light-inducible protein CPRF2 [Bienertia sinuspersici]